MIAGFAALFGVVIGVFLYIVVAKWFYERKLRRELVSVVWTYERRKAEMDKFFPPDGKWGA